MQSGETRHKLRTAVFIAVAVLAAVMLTLVGDYMIRGGGHSTTLAKEPDQSSSLPAEQPGSGANGAAQGTSVPSGSMPTTGNSTQPSPSTAPGFRVVEAILRADPGSYTGLCPTTIKFTGRISVAGGSGDVSYRFIRSDGASSPVERLHFPGPGSADVSTTWTLGGSGFKYSGSQQIQIFDPASLTSEKASFTVACSRVIKPPFEPVKSGGALAGLLGDGSGSGAGSSGSPGDSEPACGKFRC
jgi:hypothetical protein